MSINYRPGVFTNYTITSSTDKAKGKPIGIIASSLTSTNSSKISKFTSLEQALDDYADDSGVLDFLRTITKNCNSDIYVIGINTSDANKVSAYKNAFALLFNFDDVYCITSDFVNQEILSYIKTKFSANKGVGKIFAGNAGDINNDIQFIRSLNCERICLCAPIFYRPLYGTNVACAAFTSILARNILPISNCVGESVLDKHVGLIHLSELDKQLYIENGISPFEQIGGQFELIRGVTTRSTDINGVFSSTYRNIGIIVGLDFVLSRLKIVISQQLKGGGASIDALSSIIICELLKLTSERIITGYSKPIITQSKTDLSACNASVFIELQQNINRVELNLNFNI